VLVSWKFSSLDVVIDEIILLHFFFIFFFIFFFSFCFFHFVFFNQLFFHKKENENKKRNLYISFLDFVIFTNAIVITIHTIVSPNNSFQRVPYQPSFPSTNSFWIFHKIRLFFFFSFFDFFSIFFHFWFWNIALFPVISSWYSSIIHTFTFDPFLSNSFQFYMHLPIQKE